MNTCACEYYLEPCWGDISFRDFDTDADGNHLPIYTCEGHRHMPDGGKYIEPTT